MIKRILFSIFIVLIFSLVSCTTKDGSLNIQDEKGILYVSLENSDLEAKIFINNLPTKFTTPSTLEFLPGEYNVKVHLPGYEFTPDSFTVLVEEKLIIEKVFTAKPVSTGNLDINSNVSGFTLMIDGIISNTENNKVSNISTGKHKLEILKPGYYKQTHIVDIDANSTKTIEIALEKKSDIFLIEHFSNVNCNPCAERDEALENFILENDSLEILSIGYHPNFPSDSDPIYLAAREENLERTDYYNVSATPGFFINGNPIAAYSNNHLVRGINQYIDTYEPTVELEQFQIIIENHIEDIEGIIVIKGFEDYSVNLKVRIALIEKEIEFPEPPGTNGMEKFHDIIRAFSIGNSGNDILLKESAKSFNFSFEKNTLWETDLQIVALLQNEDTKEILASTKSLIIRN